MTRQAATKHLALLKAANLVAIRWHWRQNLHYLNPVPLHEIYDRWIAKYEVPHLQALSNLKTDLEQQKDNIMNAPELVYKMYIRSTPEKTWEAITDPKFTRQ